MKQSESNSFKEYRNNIIHFWEQNIEKYIQTSNVTTAESKVDIEAIAKEKIKEITKLTEKLKVKNFITLRKFKFNAEKQLNENLESKQTKKIEIENIIKKELISNEVNEVDRLFEYDSELTSIDLPF